MNKITGFISPVILNGPVIRSSNLWVNDNGPEGILKCDVNIDMEPSNLEEVGDMLYLPTKIAVLIELYDVDDDDIRGENRMRAEVSLGGGVSVSKQVSKDLDSVYANLRLNAISMFYAFARSHIEQVTAMSPMKRFTIPAIDPQECLNWIDSKTAA